MICRKCGVEKTDADFSKGCKSCKLCESKRKKEFYSNPENKARKAAKDKQYSDSHPERRKRWYRTYYDKNQEKIKEKEFNRVEKLRKEVFAAYGNKCSCCGETEPLFLTIDHVFNDGAEERKKNFGSQAGTGVGNMYRLVKKKGFPKDRYALLCYNCNCGKARNKGVCPHLHQEAIEMNKEFDNRA